MSRSILATALTLTLCLAGVATPAHGAVYPFNDDFEGGLANWSASAPWGLTTAYYSSAAHSVTDSPSTLYGSSADTSLALATSLDLTGATASVLAFHHRYQIEAGYDSGTVEISTDGGASWSAVLATYSGSQPDWTREQVDLSAYAGANDVRIRFRLVTDGTVQQDGWYIDDVTIGEAPAAVTLAAPTASSPNAVDLSWTTSADADFSAYRIYRSTGSPVDWHTASLVAEITDSAVTSYTDVSVTPKSTYYYAVMVTTSRDLHSLSAEGGVTTPPGMDYPFLDTAEGTGSAWTAEAPWAISGEDAFAGGNAWSDSPGGDYGNGIASQSLTLASPVDLSSATDPVLGFEHRWSFAAGDSGNLEISTDSGSTWASLASYTNGDSGGWLRVRIDLGAYAGEPSVLLRFRITTDPSGTADGWHIDDISLAESPTVVDPPILDQVTSHSIRLTWARCNDTLFSHYAVFRDTSDTVGINSTLVAVIADQDTTTFVDTGLALDTDYFYRVYAVNPYGTFSPDAASASTARTAGNPFPFSDDFEGSLDAWNLTGAWAATAADQHGGARSLTDSPGTIYDNGSDTEARTAIDLTGTTWPVLRFWDRHAFADTGDWARVEVSPDGASWTIVYTATGTRTTWAEQAIDLSEWKTSSNLRIRFRVTTNSSGADDGWYVDDVSVAEHAGSVALPFFDGAETGTGNWLPAAWAQSADTPHSGTSCFRSTPSGLLLASGRHTLELAGELDLSSAADPQLVYWLRGTVADDGGFAAQVSTNGGLSWSTLPGGSIGQNTAIPSWTRYQFSLASYLQAGVRIRFIVTQSRYLTRATDIYLDDIAIEETPDSLTLNAPVPHLKSVDLSWTQTTLGGNFVRYEVYRATHAGVTPADTLVFSSTTDTDTSFTDTGLSIGATYYYRVFSVDTNSVYTPSNERSTTTVPLSVPFSDPMENLDNWDATGTWGPDSGTFHGGSASLNDSPGDISAVSSNTYILTAVDLSGTTWPVLRFWDSFALADDWGYLEVSPNGSSWYRVYTATGTRATWAEQAVDLSEWKTADNLRIRFTVDTNGSNAGSGWFLDDLSVADHAGSVALPFLDGAESGTGNWLPAAWTQSADGPHSGTACFRSTPSGVLRASGQHAMVLAGELDLSAATDPQLVFWMRGAVGYGGSFYVQASTNGGLSWTTLYSVGESTIAAWTRHQLSLASFLQPAVRLRFYVSQGSSTRSTDIYLDDIAIEETPDSLTLNAPVPHLKSVDLSWSQTTLGGNFARYEVYRATHSSVTPADTLVFSSTTDTDTSFTDTGLSIGSTYYYKVFSVDQHHVYSPSNERTATTVPLTLPVSDPMENLDNWDATGSWGPDGTTPHGGSFSLTDSPSADYPVSSNTYILTAVDLTGSAWPVLRFWDRAAFADTSDWGWVEVSTNGSSWSRVYSITGTHTTWAEQAVDLSPWRTSNNLRIRFTVATSSSGVDDGWYIDDLSITDHSGAASFPLLDDAESGIGNWLPAAWTVSADSPHGGSACFRSTPSGTLRDATQHALVLAGELDLSAATDPQLVFWMRGAVGYRGSFYVQASTNGGLSWTTLYSVGESTIAAWTRHQLSLASFLQPAVRLRFYVSQGSSTRSTDIYLDDIAIEETPVAVTLNSPDQITISSMRLTWNDPGAPEFAAYRVYRSETSTVNTGSTLLATITDPAATTFTDTGLQARRTYFYRVYLVDTQNVYSPSNTASAMTAAVGLPFTDDFEADSGAWTLTGDWSRQAAGGSGGSTGLTDSPADYTPSSDTWAVTGVDLSSTSWPVLGFTDRFDFGSGDWGRVEISDDGGSSWTTLYGANGSQPDWTGQTFDLSPWRTATQVWVRFRVTTDGGTPTSDGWHIDNVFIGENPLAGTLSYPFFSGGESGTADWLDGPWGVTADTPYEGSACFTTTDSATRLGGSELRMVWGDAIDLSTATEPILTFQIRGDLSRNTYFRVQVSTDAGTSWQDLTDLSLNYYWSSADWVRMQTSLSTYLVPDLRLRFVVTGNYGGGRIFLDNISVGPQTPAAPTLASPAQGDNVTEVYPVLVVNNAVDYQSDPLTYEFQVFDDSGLTNMVAQVPVVSSGSGTTSWTLDTELPTDHQYWWRCRATDDTGHTGPWMDTATFFLQITDHPPTVPVLLSPANGGELPDLGGRLSWLASTDPEEANGDYVASYAVQVDDDPAFGSPEIDDTVLPAKSLKDAAISVTLGSLNGSGSLVLGTRYYWRVNARDSQGASSAWSAGPAYFVYGTDQQAPSCAITAPADGATLTTSPISISGTASDDLSGVDVVEVSMDGGATWQAAAGTSPWLYQWSPAASGDSQLSCRARDVAGNQGAPSSPITVHVDLSRTVAYAVDASWVDESAGTANVTLVLSGPRTDPVTVDVTVAGGTAAAGTDYISPAQTIAFAPGQTAAVFTVTIVDDTAAEPNETVILGLDHASPSDVTVGAVSTFTLHLVNDDSRADLDRDGQVTGNDMVVLLLEIFDLDGTATGDVPGSTNPGWDGYDLDTDGKVLGSDVAEEIRAFHE